MSVSPRRHVDREQERALHRRLVEDDPVAPAELAATYLASLFNWLKNRNRQVDEHLCEEAAEDALLVLIRNPASYHPDKRSLEAYLRMSGQGDLRNRLRKERKYLQRHRSWDDVELHKEAGKYHGAENPVPDGDEKPIRLESIVTQENEKLSEPERRVMDLLQKGERRTAVFAEAFGVSHLPLQEQRREVKRVKDRLKIRLRRAGRKE